jgi:hypothetical protein
VQTVSDRSYPFSQPDPPGNRYPPTSEIYEPLKPAPDILSSRKQPRGETNRNQLQTLPLPQYHPDLPPIDRMKGGKAFYTDLQDKFIIAGFDEKRFSCWCHVENWKQGMTSPLSINHTRMANGKTSRHRSSYWFSHAQSCKFYKVSRISFTLRMV